MTTRLARETAAARLNELLSRSPDEALGAPPDPSHRRVPGPLDRLVALARSHRPEFAARAATVARNEEAVALARRDYLPDFDLTFERFYNRDRRDGYGAMVGMTLPWPFVYRRNAGLDEARARLGAEEAMRRRTQDQVAAAVKTALATLQAAAAEHELLAATHVPQAEQAYTASRDAYAAGQMDFTGLLDSLRMVEATHIEHYDAAAAFEKAYASLEAAVGTELPGKDE